MIPTESRIQWFQCHLADLLNAYKSGDSEGAEEALDQLHRDVADITDEGEDEEEES